MAQSATTRSDDVQPLDRLFDVLSDSSRRRLLFLVGDSGSREELDVEAITTGNDDLEELATELHHVHLPKLAEAGYLEWNREDGTVRRGSAFDEIEPVLGVMDDHRDELPDGWP